MQQIRVAVGKMPQLLREIVISTLNPHEDFSLVELASDDISPEGLALAEADVLIVGCDRANLSGEQESLLFSRPNLRILALDGGGREAAVYSLRPQRFGVTEVTPLGLAAAIRSACGAEPLDHRSVASRHEN